MSTTPSVDGWVFVADVLRSTHGLLGRVRELYPFGYHLQGFLSADRDQAEDVVLAAPTSSMSACEVDSETYWAFPMVSFSFMFQRRKTLSAATVTLTGDLNSADTRLSGHVQRLALA